MIIGEKGCGKTTAIDQYCKANPTNTFRVTINAEDGIRDILEEIGRLLDLDLPMQKGARLRLIGSEFRRRALCGERNMLILDEGENTKLPGIRAYKAIYDMIKGYAAFAIAGTADLLKLARQARTARCQRRSAVQKPDEGEHDYSAADRPEIRELHV